MNLLKKNLPYIVVLFSFMHSAIPGIFIPLAINTSDQLFETNKVVIIS